MHLSKHRLQVKTVQKSCHMWVNFDVMWTTGDGLYHWRKRYYGLWTCILARSY